MTKLRTPIRLEGRRQKFNAQPTVVDNVRFASKRESRRYLELKMLQEAGTISSLQLQPRFPIRVNGQHICDYLGDFAYNQHLPGGQSGKVVEDVKSVHTRKLPIYRLKKKLVEAIYNIQIQEV